MPSAGFLFGGSAGTHQFPGKSVEKFFFRRISPPKNPNVSSEDFIRPKVQLTFTKILRSQVRTFWGGGSEEFGMRAQSQWLGPTISVAGASLPSASATISQWL